MFKFKKWLWSTFTSMMGADRAYAKYLAHFAHYQQHVVDKTLQQDLKLSPMSKQDFIKAWQGKRSRPSCKPGGCG